MVTRHEADRIIGAAAYDPGGQKIGSVGQVYLDEATGEPEWMTVKTGFFGLRESFVPLSRVNVRDDDRVEVEVEVDKDMVMQAPNVDPDQELSQDDEARLYEHYGMPYGEAYGRGGIPEDEPGGATVRDGDQPRERDDAMTRSEERLRVGTTTQPSGRVRLRKYVVTEPVEQTVQVRREEARIEREPITDANRDQAMSGPDISEAEHEVTLHTERPVVEKEAVPVERVRLTKDEVTGEETVSEELRREQIETEGDVAEGPDGGRRTDRG